MTTKWDSFLVTYTAPEKGGGSAGGLTERLDTLLNKFEQAHQPVHSVQLVGKTFNQYEFLVVTRCTVRDSVDPIHFRKVVNPSEETVADGYSSTGWYFYTETWSSVIGPFETAEEARKQLLDYGTWLENPDGTWSLPKTEFADTRADLQTVSDVLAELPGIQSELARANPWDGPPAVDEDYKVAELHSIRSKDLVFLRRAMALLKEATEAVTKGLYQTR